METMFHVLRLPSWAAPTGIASMRPPTLTAGSWLVEAVRRYRAIYQPRGIAKLFAKKGTPQ